MLGCGFVGACVVAAVFGLLNLQASVLGVCSLEDYLLAATGTRLFIFMCGFLQARGFMNGFLRAAFLNRNHWTTVTPAIVPAVWQHVTVIEAHAAC